MAINLRGRSFLTLKDFTSKEIGFLLDLSRDLKEKKRRGEKGDLLFEKSIVLLFDKPSTRTRCAFEVAAHDEGANVTFLSNSHMGHKESIEDTAKVLGRMYDGIEFRGYSHSIVDCLAQNAGVPVWNGLTDQFHPTQILADFLTLQEKTGKPLHHTKLVFVGDARNNMGNSLMIGAAKMGMHFVGLAPKSLWPEKSLIAEMQAVAADTGAKIEFHEDIKAAVSGADAIYTDVWVSMGEEDQYAERIEMLSPYQVNQAMLDMSGNSDVLFMHCLPAFHNLKTEVAQDIKEKFGLSEMEVTDEVFRGRHSVVFDEAENRLHTIKAVMVSTIGNI
jgi:ornithine carbamoyltransferase